jgi:hypothetical protein
MILPLEFGKCLQQFGFLEQADAEDLRDGVEAVVETACATARKWFFPNSWAESSPNKGKTCLGGQCKFKSISPIFVAKTISGKGLRMIDTPVTGS